MDKGIEYFFKEGCFIEEWHNTATDPSMSIARVRVEPQKTTNSHSLIGTHERYIILQGVATVWVGGEQSSLQAKDVVNIPPGVAQSIRNDGSEDLIFIAICTPRFEEDNYQQL